jgi:rhodanese-related sulfurtransferase
MFGAMKNNNINSKNLTAIIIISILLGLSYNYFRGDSLPLIRAELKLEGADDAANNSAGNQDNNAAEFTPKLIDLSQAYTLYDQNAAVFIDARDKWEYGDGHIKGAVNIPEYIFEPKDTSKIKAGKDDILVLYCGGNDCDVSKRLAVELSELGYQQLFVFEGGWNKWRQAGYPTAGGSE